MLNFKIALSLKTMGLIITTTATVATSIWGLSKQTTIRELQRKNTIDSVRYLSKSNNETKLAICEVKNIVLSIRDSLKSTNRNVKAVTQVMKSHILETSDMKKDIKQIQTMYETLGPFLNYNSIPDTLTEKKKWILCLK